jgi:hypothetical protein
MDQEPSQVREGVAAPPEGGDEERGPEEIREDIEQTREELGETVEALSHKADVKGQAKSKVDETKAQARAKVEDIKETVSQKREEAAAKAPDGASAGAQQVAQTAQENPLPFAVGGALVAALAPRTRLAHLQATVPAPAD